MRQALAEAAKAFEKGEIPVGAVFVCGEETIIASYNMKEQQTDPTGHAEISALREAASRLGRWRLGGTLYVTLEPCAMCAGALIQARVDRLVFGAFDRKAGACGSVLEVVREPRFNHRIDVVGGILAEESSSLLRAFFGRLRNERGLEASP